MEGIRFRTIGDDLTNAQILPNLPFRDKVRVFLREFYTVEGMPIWCTLLVHENRNLVVPLYTIEEDVKSSSKPYYDHRRCTGHLILCLLHGVAFMHPWFPRWGYRFCRGSFGNKKQTYIMAY